MQYLIAVETGDEEYGVVVPDLPGCFSAGDTLDEALINARETILLHPEGLLDESPPIPKPSTIDQLRSKRSYRDLGHRRRRRAVTSALVTRLDGRSLAEPL
jgi:predicted RNase H-like HicB family nuclease